MEISLLVIGAYAIPSLTRGVVTLTLAWLGKKYPEHKEYYLALLSIKSLHIPGITINRSGTEGYTKEENKTNVSQ